MMAVNSTVKNMSIFLLKSEVKAAALSSMLAQIALIDALYLLTARYKKHIWSIEALNQMFDKTLRNKI